MSILLTLLKKTGTQLFYFLILLRETFAQLARMSGMGSRYPVDNPRLQGLRKWAVKGFKRYLIFYFERDESIEIVRLLYAGQDIENILEQE